jgi:hypothetical protein
VNPLTCQAAVHAASEHEAANIDGTVDMPMAAEGLLAKDMTNTKDPVPRYLSLHGPSRPAIPGLSTASK